MAGNKRGLLVPVIRMCGTYSMVDHYSCQANTNTYREGNLMAADIHRVTELNEYNLSYKLLN